MTERTDRDLVPHEGGADLWQLLRRLDDPDRFERPADHDEAAVRESFERLVQRLEADFDCTCSVERDVQGGSHHGWIGVPPSATVSGPGLGVAVSNFGRLATWSSGSVRVRRRGEPVDAADSTRVEAALADLGYVLVPEPVLRRPYDGSYDVGDAYEPQDPATWRTRFFGYFGT